MNKYIRKIRSINETNTIKNEYFTLKNPILIFNIFNISKCSPLYLYITKTTHVCNNNNDDNNNN
jgi:hypothetical protein